MDRWANIDAEHFQVNDAAGWADVTEGNKLGWDAPATLGRRHRTVGVETLESNLWGPGSRWDYRISPSQRQ